MIRRPPRSTLFPYNDALPIFSKLRGTSASPELRKSVFARSRLFPPKFARLKTKSAPRDRKSTRLNSSHSQISYAVFCLKKKKHRLVLCTYDHDKSRLTVQSTY